MSHFACLQILSQMVIRMWKHYIKASALSPPRLPGTYYWQHLQMYDVYTHSPILQVLCSVGCLYCLFSWLFRGH